VAGVRDDAGLRAGHGHGLVALGVDRHGQQRDRDLLARGEQHVHLTGGRLVADLARELEQVVGDVTHGADHRDDLISAVLAADDAASDIADALGIADGRAAVFLDDKGHASPFGQVT
jgi:hypothetical protein